MADKAAKGTAAEGELAEGNVSNAAHKSATPAASGRKAVLGDQVDPATMLDESDGNRTLMKPRTDPGPVGANGMPVVRHPDRRNGEVTYTDANEPISVLQRTSTTPPHFHRDGPEGVVNTVNLAPDLYIHGGASDMYNPEKGEGLTDKAVERASAEKELAPQSD